jgi:hypothetical protein
MTKLDNFNSRLSILAVLLIIFSAYYTWWWADDYCAYNDIMHAGSIFNHIINQYMNWDGRFISLAGLIQTVFLKYFQPEVAIFFWAICFCAGTLLFLRLVLPVKNIGSKTLIIGYSLFIVLLWQGMKPYVSQIIYWVTGGAYSFHLLIAGFFLYYYYTQFIKSKISLESTIILLIISLLAGGTSQNLTLALLTVLFVDLILKLIHHDLQHRKLLIFLILGLSIGLLLITFAPGNFKRATFGSNSFKPDLYTLFLNYLKVLMYYFSECKLLILYSTLFIPLIRNISFRSIFTSLTIRKLLQAIIFPANSKWILAAFATALPFAFIPDFAVNRTTYYFAVFLSIYIISVMNDLITEEEKIEVPFNFAKGLIVTACLLLHTGNIGYEMYRARKIKHILSERNKMIQQSSEKELIIVKIQNKEMPVSHRFKDVSEKPDAWNNKCYAEYFGLTEIKAESIKK